MERRLKRSVLYGLIGLGCILFVGIIYLIESMVARKNFDDENVYVTTTIIDKVVPVINDASIMIKPYVNNEVSVYKNFYNKDSSFEEQENSIIEYQNTYLQSSGICYKLNRAFDVVAIMDGIVSDIKQDELLGNIVEIRHNNNVISIYAGLSDIGVEKDMKVKSGDMIGVSGNSNIFNGEEKYLYFELAVNGKLVNPEEYYSKPLSEI